MIDIAKLKSALLSNGYTKHLQRLNTVLERNPENIERYYNYLLSKQPVGYQASTESYKQIPIVTITTDVIKNNGGSPADYWAFGESIIIALNMADYVEWIDIEGKTHKKSIIKKLLPISFSPKSKTGKMTIGIVLLAGLIGGYFFYKKKK